MHRFDKKQLVEKVKVEMTVNELWYRFLEKKNITSFIEKQD